MRKAGCKDGGKAEEDGAVNQGCALRLSIPETFEVK